MRVPYVLTLLFPFVVGCGRVQASRTSMSAPNVSAVTNPSSGAEGERGGRLGGPVPRPRLLTRADVERLLADGLGSFLSRVDVSPVVVRGRFVGFRLDGARDLETWRAAGVDLRVGDVIVRVNGIRVERPEQALWAFERLRIVSAVEVQLLREGTLLTLRSPIVD